MLKDLIVKCQNKDTNDVSCSVMDRGLSPEKVDEIKERQPEFMEGFIDAMRRAYPDKGYQKLSDWSYETNDTITELVFLESDPDRPEDWEE